MRFSVRPRDLAFYGITSVRILERPKRAESMPAAGQGNGPGPRGGPSEERGHGSGGRQRPQGLDPSRIQRDPNRPHFEGLLDRPDREGRESGAEGGGGHVSTAPREPRNPRLLDQRRKVTRPRSAEWFRPPWDAPSPPVSANRETTRNRRGALAVAPLASGPSTEGRTSSSPVPR